MRFVIATALSLVVSAAVAEEVEAPSMESGHYADLCKDKNTKRGVLDEEGYAYCFKRQTEGNRKLAEVLKENQQYSWLKGVLELETELRRKRGTRDDDVLAFTVARQVEAFKDFDYAVHQPDYVPRVGEACKESWTTHGSPNWEMIVSCYKQRIGAD